MPMRHKNLKFKIWKCIGGKEFLEKKNIFIVIFVHPLKPFALCALWREGEGGDGVCGGMWLVNIFHDNLNLIVFISDLCETFREKKSFPSDQIGFMFMQSKSDWWNQLFVNRLMKSKRKELTPFYLFQLIAKAITEKDVWRFTETPLLLKFFKTVMETSYPRFFTIPGLLLQSPTIIYIIHVFISFVCYCYGNIARISQKVAIVEFDLSKLVNLEHVALLQRAPSKMFPDNQFLRRDNFKLFLTTVLLNHFAFPIRDDYLVIICYWSIGIFRTLSNIYDKALLRTIFPKKLHRRCSTEF